MISVDSADKALKEVYLGVIGNQLNLGSNPLLTKIKQTTNNVQGFEVVKSICYGMSGGVTAAGEGDELPGSYNKQYLQFRANLKNLYGTIEITDKALRCSQTSSTAFVNLLNDEMESLIKSSTFNLSRMLYGDGSGIIANIVASNEAGDYDLHVDSVRNFAPNLAFRIINPNDTYGSYEPMCVKALDKVNNIVTSTRYADKDFNGYKISTLRGLKNEITGLEALFNNTTLYTLKKSSFPWLQGYTKENVGALSEVVIQAAIDEVEELSGNQVDYISCSAGVRRAYQDALSTMRRNVDVMNLDGGFRAISYNGIPLVVDRFVKDDVMYLLNTKDFEFCQLGDWQWLEGNDGKIIKQKDNYPIYTATLVKYAELICDRPNAQAKLSGITTA